ncbi:unnamed protein product [Moneuplotes crassus]|uniref:Uncharacterized protein n=1 Tax=Euplotes crassus TaxID=5936 RepID=A0AAD1Y922_EUPCR|nr:unnamed protein product [Moneuplotes crassus]
MDLGAGLAAAQANQKEMVCNLTSWEEFWESLDKYTALCSDPTSKLVFVDDEQQNVYSWIHKNADEMVEKIDEKTDLKEISEILLKFDQKLTHYQKFYKDHGSDLFEKFFRMQLMDHPSCVVDFDKTIQDIVKEEGENEQKLINRVIDNILLKIIDHSDGQEMLVCMVSVMFEGKQHSIVVMKSLLIFSKIFTKAKENQAKYLQGSLYTLGALLKVEARSYLCSKDERDLISEDCKEEEDKHFEVKIRDLSQCEINHFENELQHTLSRFVESLVDIKDIRNGIQQSTMSLHSEIIQEDFLEKYDQENKINHVNLMRSEASNTALLFLLDLLQFFYQFLAKANQRPLEGGRYSVEGESKYARLYNTLPAYMNHTFEYTVNDSVFLVQNILKAISAISPNPAHTLELWHLRRHIEVLTNIDSSESAREEQSYERTDKFNSIGLLMYMYWSLKPRINSTVEEEYRIGRFTELEGFESPLPETTTREFEFEILFPLICNAMKGKVSYPVVFDVSMEILSYFVRVVNPKKLQFPGCKVSIAGNAYNAYKELLQHLMEYIGNQSVGTEEKSKVVLELFKKLLGLYPPSNMEDIMFDLIVESKHDKERGLLVDLYKNILLKANQESGEGMSVIQQFKDHLRLLIDHHFDTDKEYIFDITERIISTLNLWRSLYSIEKQRDEICETAKKLHEQVSQKNCTDISNLVDSLEPGLVKEKEDALSNPNLGDDNKTQMQCHWDSNLMKLMIIREVVACIREM